MYQAPSWSSSTCATAGVTHSTDRHIPSAANFLGMTRTLRFPGGLNVCRFGDVKF
jgi:hypothetical protein